MHNKDPEDGCLSGWWRIDGKRMRQVMDHPMKKWDGWKIELIDRWSMWIDEWVGEWERVGRQMNRSK